ncbi:hypothetical protein V1503_24365 [Bacillus sp. SCS-151]|uniref:hypothetical protein n=1 Tax=Nanhaiella sioensis TaxID=3115293 RepID=UPI003979AC20
MFKKILPSIMALILVFAYTVNEKTFATNNTEENRYVFADDEYFEELDMTAKEVRDNIEIITDNEQKIIAKFEIENYNAKMTYDKETKEITVKEKYKEQDQGNKNKDVENDYIVHVNDLYYNEDLKKKILDVEFENITTGKKHKVVKNKDNVKASAIPIIVGIGAVIGTGLLEALAAAALVIIISAQEFARVVEIIEKLRNNNKYDYYAAAIQNDNVYVGPAITKTDATNRVKWSKSAAFEERDVWARNQILAYNLADAAAQYVWGYEIHGGQTTPGNGYYYHYHASNTKKPEDFGKLPSHIFFW